MENNNGITTQLSSVASLGGLPLTTITTNQALIKEKSEKALAVLASITTVDTDEQDLYANNVLVKCNATYKVIEELRKAYTSPIKTWCDGEAEAEKNLDKAMSRIKSLRNARANRIAAEDAAKKQLIEKERAFKEYEITIKQKIKTSIEVGVAKKIIELETAMAELLSRMTLDNRAEVEKMMNFTPKLKEDYFKGLFFVQYDGVIMTQPQYEDLLNRALGYYSYQVINDKYVAEASAVLIKYKAGIAPRFAQLQKIAKGDTLAQKQSESIAAQEKESREAAASKLLESIESGIQNDTQEEILKNEFDAQLQTQSIATQAGGRKKTTFRLSAEVEKDMMKLSSMIAKLVLNTMLEPETKGIYERDAQKFPKMDEKGNPIYVAGIKYWLDMMEKVSYAGTIEGLIKTEEVITIARKQ